VRPTRTACMDHLIIPQVPWPRGYATVTAPSWVTAPSPKKEPPVEKEKAYIRVATVSN